MRKILFILLTFTVLLSSCKKENTVWETDWSAPIIDDTLSLANWVNDSTLSEVGGFYALDMRRTLIDRNVNDFLAIPDTVIKKTFGISFAFISVPPNYTFFSDESENDMGFDDVELKQIIAGEGFLDIVVKNPIGTKASFTITLVGVKKDGVEFSQTILADAGTIANPGIVSKTLDLSGYSFDLTGVNGNKRNILTSRVTVTSDPAGPVVTVTNADIVKVDVGLRGMTIDYARGYFGNRIVSDTTDFQLDIMKLVQSGTIDLPASTIKFKIENGIKVGATGFISMLRSENSAGNIVNLAHPQVGTAFNMSPATGGWNGTLTPSVKEIIFNSINSNMEAMFENLGSKYTAGYKIEMNPWGNISSGSDEIYPDSRLKVKVEALMPLAMGANALVIRDTFAVDLSQTSENVRVTKGELMLKAKNAFPISADVKLVLLDANKVPLHTILGTDKINSAEYGAIDPSSGLKVKTSDIKFDLSNAVVADLDNVKYIIVQSQFDTPNASTGVNEQFQIPVGAFLGVKLRTRFTTENQF
jgi:hypothetical protein